jgi:hypothetical protein
VAAEPLCAEKHGKAVPFGLIYVPLTRRVKPTKPIGSNTVQTRFEVYRATLFSTAMAGALTLGVSAPASADLFAFGQTGASGQYFSYGSLEVSTNGVKSTISTEGHQGWLTPQINSGQSHPTGSENGGSTNFLAGTCGATNNCEKAVDHDNYFVFSLANIKTPVTTATLSLKAGQVVGTGYYNIYDATPLANELLAGPESGNTPLYQKLTTSGALIGFALFTDSDTGGSITVTLNDLGLRDLNYDIAKGVGNFAIGGSVSSPDPDPAKDPFPPPVDPPPSAPSPLPGVGLLQFLCLLGFLAFAAARARFRA